jgi:peptide/nickel transport system substrate-binding protein
MTKRRAVCQEQRSRRKKHRLMRAFAIGAPTAVALVVAACGGAQHAARVEATVGGGTLRVGLTGWAGHEQRNSVPGSQGRFFYAFDPQEIRYPPAFELFRCCLLRTLLSYNGRPTGQGGTVLRPDLATSLPAVSADGLTWTFHLKHGLHYAPPLQTTEIVAQDVIRAVEREFSPAPVQYRKLYPNPVLGHYVELYDGVIAGTKAFQQGKTANISGLEAPDRYTLVVHLLKPSGDLGYAFSMPATAPIPPNPSNPDARLGVAAGHSNGYGRFLVASGPYMIAGSDKLDFALPPPRQKPVSGYVPGKRFTFVRNPSWDPATDSLRRASVDRIEFTLLPEGPFETKYGREVDTGKLDLLLDTEASDEQLARPANRRLYTAAADTVYFFRLNVALPPFDDVHVRRAANLVIDKARMARSIGNPLRSLIVGHLAPDGLEGNLLLDYDPYATPHHRGDLVAAKAELAKSRYDRNHDGVCDVSVCRRIRAVPFFWPPPPPDRLFAAELKQLGITIRYLKLSTAAYSYRFADPHAKTGVISHGFFKDIPNASAFFVGAFSSVNVPGGNTSLLGLSREQLRRYGYASASVPSVDRKIASCEPLVGETQTECWAELDQLLMATIVPWVPFLSDRPTREVSARVVRFSFDQFASLPALDQIALRNARVRH